MHRRRTEGRGGLNEVLSQAVAILYLVSYLAKSEWEYADTVVILFSRSFKCTSANLFYKTYVSYAYLNSLSMLTYLKLSSALAVQHVAFQDNITTSSL